MNKIERELSFLLSRLAWPSGMVRERACLAIVDLLFDSRYAETAEKNLLNWIKAQTLESISSIGLIILLYTKTAHADFLLPPRETITRVITKQSLLSHMILKELFPEETVSADIQAMNSGQAPDEFNIDPFFIKYSRNFLPPIYMDIMEHIESKKRVPLIKQWAFEWNKILECAGRSPSSQSLNYFYENEYSDYTVVRDVYLSEVYRSAYLRAISWSIASRTLSENEGIRLAIKTCPIDLGLWFLKSNIRPDWWPMQQETPLESTDIPGRVWDLIKIIWTKTQSITDDWIIAEASGYVSRGNILYDLEVNGFFQKQSDEQTLNLELLCSQYRLINEIEYDPFNNGLDFQGIIEPRSIDSFHTQFGDIIPASCFIWPLAAPRWQFWRMHRGVWLPNSCISPHLAFKCSNNAIVVSDYEDIIGKWIDWRDILKEKATANLPPLTGQYLQIKRDKINEFIQANDLTFCWICRLIKYERDHSLKQYVCSMDHRIYK